MISIAIISNPDKISGKLTSLFTGSPAYHIGFVDLENNKFYDQNLLFRRRWWPHYKADHVRMYECPVLVSSEYLENRLDTDTDTYGVFDYLSFAFKGWLFKSRPSFKGSICSEKVEQILMDNGWKSPFKWTPSPADFEKVLTPL